jgi:hypothetical protein
VRAPARRARRRWFAPLVLVVVATACANTKFNQIGPGERRADARQIPGAVTLRASGFDVELDPTVMLWAEDAELDLRTIVRGAVRRAQRTLEATPAHISIVAGSYRTIPDVGIGGNTDRITGAVRVTMDQRSPVGLGDMLRTWLPLAVAHELHHSARILDGPGYGDTLLDAIVTEGAAEAFARETYPDAPPIPWVRELSDDDRETVWREARDELDFPDDPDRHERWFYGKDGLPRWAGYRLGYAIVTAYLERHHVDAADLVGTSASDVLDGSGFGDRALSSTRGPRSDGLRSAPRSAILLFA